jgi:folylpolyglutamate synthase/dihydropteroate synthase
VVGALKDKASDRTCRALVPRADEVIVTEPASKRRLHADELFYTVGRYAPGRPVRVIDGLEDALRAAAARMRGRKGSVLVAGSIFMLAQAREMLGRAQTAQDFRLSEVLATPQGKQ